MSRISVCVVLLTFLVIVPTARAQEAREPAKRESEAERVKKTHAQPPSKVGTGEKPLVPSKPAKPTNKANLTKSKGNFANHDKTKVPHYEMPEVPVPWEEPRGSEQTEHNKDVAVKHEHHGEVGCDRFKDAVAKKKCEQERQKARLPKQNDPK